MTHIHYILDAEEQEILDFIDSGSGTTVANFPALKEDLILSAREHLQRKSITIRIQTPLLREIRSQAARKGMPYQTYIQSALSQFVERDMQSK